MKANRALRQTGLVLLITLAATLAACSGQREAPPSPTPRPTPTQRPIPPSPPPRATDWRDMPITPGNWRWGMEGGSSVARFGNNTLVLSCNRSAGSVTLTRPGNADGAVPMTIITSNARQTLTGQPVAGPPPSIALTFQVRDSLLDAMAFSRGRFAIETAGLPTLYVPSWPEVSRVIEDCR